MACGANMHSVAVRFYYGTVEARSEVDVRCSRRVRQTRSLTLFSTFHCPFYSCLYVVLPRWLRCANGLAWDFHSVNKVRSHDCVSAWAEQPGIPRLSAGLELPIWHGRYSWLRQRGRRQEFPHWPGRGRWRDRLDDTRDISCTVHGVWNILSVPRFEDGGVRQSPMVKAKRGTNLAALASN